MQKRSLLIALFFGACHLIWSPIMAQYTLDEIGINVGGGFAYYNTEFDSEKGLGINVNGFYGHYFCGKAYGIHAQGGFNFLNTGDEFIGRSQLQFEGGFFFKLKRRDYHRPREWAVLVGPKFQVPIVTSSRNKQFFVEPLADWTPIVPVAHISVQFRRPAPEKKSWFIQPGFELGLLPDFTLGAANYRRNYIFLHFGYAFFDKRG